MVPPAHTRCGNHVPRRSRTSHWYNESKVSRFDPPLDGTLEAQGSSSIHATTIAVTSMTNPSPLCCGCPMPQKHLQRPRSAEIFQLWWSRPPGTERRPGRPIMFKLSSPPAVKSRASISLAPSLCGPARLFGPEGRGGRPANLKARGRPDRGAVLAHVHTDGSDWPGAEQHPGPPPSRAM